MDNNFANRLKTLRTEKIMTQDELANKVGVSRQAISKWERGEGLPDLYNISLLAKALDVSVDDLLNNLHQEEPQFQEEQPKQEQQQETRNTENSERETNQGTPYQETGNYFKRLLYKAKHTTNSAQAKKIRKTLIAVGGLGVVLGGIMVISGFFGFASGAMWSVGNFKPFNPLPFMFLFISGAFISGISLYVLLGGLSIVIAGVTTNYLDTRKKCPSCGNEIDKDELVCSNCGCDLKDKHNKLCSCGKENQPEDLYCRSCGSKL